MSESIEQYLTFAREIAHQAGEITLKYFQKSFESSTKADGSPVTIADKEAEACIRRAIEKRYPGHAILGEEMGSSREGASHRWIIDPIDGTKSFMRGVPAYSILIGLEIEGVVEVGVAHFPAMGEMLSAGRGLGCWWNERACQVSKVDELGKALLTFTDIADFEKYGRGEAFRQLSERVWYRTGWGDAYGYLLVATGRAEVMMDPIMAVWDCGPFPPILREAGGFFGDWQGKETIDAAHALATNGLLLPEVLAVLNEKR